MKLLQDLLYKVRMDQVLGNTNVAVESVTSDSRQVRKLSMFVAVRGTVTDGHAYILSLIHI